jgi:8-oxo-dGTP diphosphatase
MAYRKGVWIPVVTGLIQKEGKILMGKRPSGNSLAGQWEFPGGKIELGESPEQALKRELREELDIDAEIGALRLSNSHTYGEKAVILLFFDVLYWKGEPKRMHHSELLWVLPKDIQVLDIPPANRKILDRILKVLEAPHTLAHV